MVLQSPFPTFVLNAQGVYSIVNDAFLKLFSIPDRDYLLGKSALEIPENKQQGVVKFIEEALRGKTVDTHEVEYTSPFDGRTVTVKTKLFPIFDSEGALANIVVVQEDITDRKSAENKLRELTKRYMILFDYAPDAYYLNDLKGTFIEGNRAAESMIGYPKEELIGKNFLKLKLLDPGQLLKAAKALAKNAMGKPTGPDEFVLNRKDGTQVHAEIRTYPVTIDDKTVVLGIARDITKRKRTEQNVIESEARFRTIFENVNDVIAYLDRKGTILNINGRVKDIFGFEPKELIGKNFLKLGVLDPRELPSIARTFKGAFKKGELPKTMEVHIKRKDGLIVTVEGSYRLIRKEGKFEGLVVIVRDMTAWKEAEEKEKRYIVDAEFLSRSAFGFVGLGPEEDIWRYMGDRLHEILGGGYVFISEYDARTSSFTIRAAPGLGGRTKKIVKLLETELEGMTFPLTDPAIEQVLLEGKLRHAPGRLHQLMLEKIPERVCTQLERLIDFGDGYGCGFVRERQLLACATIILPKGYELGERRIIIETFINQASVALQHRKAEEALRESEEKYRTLVGELNDGIYEIDDQGRFTFANDALAKFFGYDRPEGLIGRSVQEFFPRERAQSEMDMIKRGMKSGEYPQFVEVPIVKKDGSHAFIELRPTPVIRDGHFICERGVIRDITERKRSEAELRRRVMRFGLEEGYVYLVEERVPSLSIEAFRDLMNVGYAGHVVSRRPEGDLPFDIDALAGYVWLAEMNDAWAVPPDVEALTRYLDGLSPRSAVLIDRLDYLLTKNGFEDTLSFVQHLSELAYIKNHVIVLTIDPVAVNKQQLLLLGKETRTVETRDAGHVPENLLEVVRFIHKENMMGIKPTYTAIASAIGVSRPTVLLRMKKLIASRYVLSIRNGRRKSVELTERGRRLFDL